MTERIEWIDQPSRLKAIASAWDALTEHEASPFADHAWFDCWWHAFGDGQGLRICALWRDDELAAAVPLSARGRRLTSLANYHSPLFHPPARDDDALERVIDAVLETDPDDLQLHGVPVGDATVTALRRVSARRKRLVLQELQHASPIVDTRGDFSDYERSRRSKLRTVQRRQRKLHREHAVSFLLDSEPDDLDAALDRGFVVEGTDWKLERGSAILSHPETATFYRELAHAYRARGELRLVWLYVDGGPAAFAFCISRGQRLYLLKHGFDTGLRKLAPGLVMQLSLVERCFELDYEAYELLGDVEEWKLLLADETRTHERWWSFRLSTVPLGRYALRRVGLPVARGGRERLTRAREARRERSARRTRV